MSKLEDCSILIVDDEQDQGQLYAKQFSRRNWRAVAVSSGKDAIAVLSEDKFGVVLLDMKMPGMDGFETLTQIIELYPNQCVIMFTGFGDVTSAVRALKMGARSMLLKDGIRFDDLFDAINTELERQSLEIRIREERDHAMTTSIRLANGCSHTIKNRLVAIATRIDLIEASVSLSDLPALVSDVRQRLGSAFDAVKRLEQICKVQTLPLVPVQLGDAISRAFAAAKTSAYFDDRFEICYISKEAEGLTVNSSNAFLADALENIIGNSLESMQENGGNISVYCTEYGGEVEITIVDTGPGFTEEMLRMAHEPFRTTKGDYNYGYGLTFSLQVVQCSGGTLEYGNRSDQNGAWVRLRLPLTIS